MIAIATSRRRFLAGAAACGAALSPPRRPWAAQALARPLPRRVHRTRAAWSRGPARPIARPDGAPLGFVVPGVNLVDALVALLERLRRLPVVD